MENFVEQTVKGREAVKAVVKEVMGERHLVDASCIDMVSPRLLCHLCAQRSWVISKSVGICVGFYTFAMPLA